MPSPSRSTEPLRAGLERLGLRIFVPVRAAGWQEVGPPRASEALGGFAVGLLVGDGGGAFFAGFRASPEAGDGDADPLDRYTRRVVEAAVAASLPSGAARAFFPFVNAEPTLPFQSLAVAGGVPPPGPLGLQIHPTYGPWWAWRAFVALRREVSFTSQPWPDACGGCPAPCIDACPVRAPNRAGFSWDACRTRRLSGSAPPDCRNSCAARRACIVAPNQAYPPEQLAFHMRASWPGGRA